MKYHSAFFGKREKDVDKILCYIYDGMADFEISLLLHRLKNTGKRDIVSISESLDKLAAQSGLKYVPDRKIEEIDDLKEYEALIIPGGPINNKQNAIGRLAVQMISEGKLVAAICFAPQFLGRAGILAHYRFTTSCSVEKIKELGCEDPFYRANYVKERVVVDQNLITAQGYAFVDFTRAVCNYLGIFESRQQEYEQIDRIKEESYNESGQRNPTYPPQCLRR